jgi:hypothetical protein
MKHIAGSGKFLYPVGQLSLVFRGKTMECIKSRLKKQSLLEQYQGRAIDRSEYAGALEANNIRVNENPGYYRQRQQIIEHVFGTQKRQRGFTNTLMRGKENVLGEVGLMFIGYNLTRCITILDAQNLFKQLLDSCLHIFYACFRLIFISFKPLIFQQAFLMLRENRNFEALKLSLIKSLQVPLFVSRFGFLHTTSAGRVGKGNFTPSLSQTRA